MTENTNQTPGATAGYGPEGRELERESLAYGEPARTPGDVETAAAGDHRHNLGRAKFNCGNLLCLHVSVAPTFRHASRLFRALSLDAAKRRIVSRYLFTLYILCPKSANTIP